MAPANRYFWECLQQTTVKPSSFTIHIEKTCNRPNYGHDNLFEWTLFLFLFDGLRSLDMYATTDIAR